MIPNEVTVLIDSREKQPLLFPGWIEMNEDRTGETRPVQVTTKRVRMPAGDYTLEGYDHICIFEVKRSLRELHNNVCTPDWQRSARALKRLSESCLYPHLLWEISPSELFQTTKYVPDPKKVFDRWMQTVARLNLRLMYGSGAAGPGPRRKQGEQMVRIMLTYQCHRPEARAGWSPSFREKMWECAKDWPDYEASQVSTDVMGAEDVEARNNQADVQDRSPEGQTDGQEPS